MLQNTKIGIAVSEFKFKTMNRIKLVFTCDNKFYPGLAGTITSLLLCSSSMEIDMYVIDGGISEKNKQDLERTITFISKEVTIAFIKPNLTSLSSFPAFFGSMMTYVRLLIPSLIQEKKVIYIDTDILFTKDIVELWAVPLNGKTAAAIVDPSVAQMHMDCSICAELGIEPTAPYFNAGLLVLDLESEQKKDVMKRALSYLTEHPEQCTYHDQSALNAMLYNDVVFIDPSWNTLSRKISYTATTDYVKLLGDINYHFVSPYKPWLYYSESLPDRIFRCLLDTIGCTYQNGAFAKTKVQFIRRKYFSRIAPIFYTLKARVLFTISGRNPDTDLEIANYWKELNGEREKLKSLETQMDAVYESWNRKLLQVMNRKEN